MKASQVSPDEASRLSALKELNILDTASEQDFDDITLLASQICETPISLITLVDENRQWFKSKQGLSFGETSGDISFCTHAIQQADMMVVPDALKDDRFKDNLLVTGEPFIRFYAGVPISSESGFLLGTLCVIDQQPRSLTAHQAFALKVLAKQVQSLLNLRAKISVRKEPEEKLAAFNNQFRLALEKIGDNVWEYDFRTGITLFSKLNNEFLGIGVSEFSDNNTLWWQSVHPDDRLLLEENDRKCRVGAIDAHSLEYRMIHKDGSVKWVLDRGVVIEKSANGLPLKIIGTHTNITSIKENKAALEESEQRWKFALEGSGDGVWDWNVQTNKVFYSKRWKAMLGFEEEDIGDDLSEREKRVHPDDRESVQHELQIHFSGAMPFYQSEQRMLCKNGTYKWILDRGMVIERDAANKPYRVIGTQTDISQIKFTELALEQRLRQFKSLSDNIPGVIYEYEFRKDGTEGLRYVSAAITKLFGITPDEFHHYHDYVHPDDIAMIESKNKISKETLEPFYCEARLVTPGKGLIWHSVTSSFSYYSEHGSKVFTGFMLDITERKKAEDQLRAKEEKYRSIIANMNLGLLEVDIREKILFANHSFCEMSGYDYDELVGKVPSEIFILGENKAMMDIKNLERKTGISDAYEIAVKNKRGQLRWWLVSGAPRFDDSGKLVGSIGIHLDITMQKKLEIDLIEARVQAEGSTRSKEVFLANMSHEIRTPMNAIVGMSNQLAKTNLDSKQQFYLDTIMSASENLLFIINDILDLSKIEAGKLQLEKIGFEPAEMVNRAIRVLSHKAEEKGLAINMGSMDNAISPVLMGDPFRLNQVLLNLVNNAIKFTEKGLVDISVAVLKDGMHHQTLQVSVHDTGIGMDTQFIKNLFEKFSQEDTSVTRQYGGTGLGMSISKDLVELMGGEMKVESKKGVGTTISFVIEFEKGTAGNLPIKQTFAFDANMLSGKKILVVDDNRMNRLVASTILKNYGAVISEVVNGQEAVDILAEKDIELVLMDIQMPVMDGMVATGIIREKISKSLPVIALTANAIKGDNDKCIEAGMNAYLSKPFNEKDLLNMVAFWLNQNQIAATGIDSVTTSSFGQLYDLSGIQMLSRGNKDFVERMVHTFITQAPVQATEMEENYRQGNYKLVAALANKLKPVLDNMGIVTLREHLAAIVKAANGEINDEKIIQSLATIKATIARAVNELKIEFPGESIAGMNE